MRESIYHKRYDSLHILFIMHSYMACPTLILYDGSSNLMSSTMYGDQCSIVIIGKENLTSPRGLHVTRK